MNLLKVVDIRRNSVDTAGAVTPLVDKNGNAYSVVTFAPFDTNYPDLISHVSEQAKRTVFAYDGMTVVKGSMLKGTISKFKTETPYQIESDGVIRQVDTITSVALGNEDGVDVANNSLRESGTTVITADGVVSVRKERVATTKAPAAAAPQDAAAAAAPTVGS